MTFASVSQFHVYLPWGQRLAYCLKCESTSRRFQPGEGPSRGLLRDCTTSPINRFATLKIRPDRYNELANTAIESIPNVP